jgi:tetratricopeptide (TPR) repeat protein
MPDRSGQQLDTYHLLRLLGSGMFGDVYLAEDHRKRHVAIKILHGEFNPRQQQKFLREVNIGLLRHPNMITIRGLGIEATTNTPYIVMEYAAQGTMLTKHPRGTPLPLETIIPYVKQIAAALQSAHDEDIIHRDVKPENILLDQSGTIKVADFGISVISQSGRTSLENPQQGRAGTPWYMAPEQIKGKPSRSSDQYALAIIIYEWLTGEPPFPGGVMEVYGQHLYATPDPLPKTIPMRSDELEAVLMKALAKDPKDRYATVQDFANALEVAYINEVQRCQLPKKGEPPKPITIDGKTSSQWFDEGYAHGEAKRHAEAIVAYSKAIELDPAYTDSYYNRGFAYYNLQQYENAIRDYNKAIELNPAYAVAYNNRGNAYDDLKHYEEAVRNYSKAIELDPAYADAYDNRGYTYYSLKRYEEALYDHNKAIKLGPTSYAVAYNNRGLVYDALKNYEQAIADYDRALALDPKYTIARENRERTLQRLNVRRRSAEGRQEPKQQRSWLQQLFGE